MVSLLLENTEDCTSSRDSVCSLSAAGWNGAWPTVHPRKTSLLVIIRSSVQGGNLYHHPRLALMTMMGMLTRKSGFFRITSTPSTSGRPRVQKDNVRRWEAAVRIILPVPLISPCNGNHASPAWLQSDFLWPYHPRWLKFALFMKDTSSVVIWAGKCFRRCVLSNTSMVPLCVFRIALHRAA